MRKGAGSYGGLANAGGKDKADPGILSGREGKRTRGRTEAREL